MKTSPVIEEMNAEAWPDRPEEDPSNAAAHEPPSPEDARMEDSSSDDDSSSSKSSVADAPVLGIAAPGCASAADGVAGAAAGNGNLDPLPLDFVSDEDVFAPAGAQQSDSDASEVEMISDGFKSLIESQYVLPAGRKDKAYLEKVLA